MRVVHNLRWPNGRLNPSQFAVWLETIQRMRGKFPRWGWITITDFSNAYFHVPFKKGQRRYISFALTVEELPPRVVQWLRDNHPHCERDGRFFFAYNCINFGFAPSAQVFCLFSQACQHVWSRCPALQHPDDPVPVQNNVSSYIDDWALSMLRFSATIYLSLNVLAGMAVLGWMVNIGKTRFLPLHEQVHLSIITNLLEYDFALAMKRIAKLLRRMLKLRQETRDLSGKVRCRTAASFVGAIFSAALVLKDKAVLWTRNIVRELAKQMRIRVEDFSLSRLLRQFWRGSMPWTPRMERELKYWEHFDFFAARALISRDFVRDRIEDQVKNPTGILSDSVTLIAQDASKIASGMQRMRLQGGRWVTVCGSMAYFSHAEGEASSTYREIRGSLLAIKTLSLPRFTEVLSPCDNINTYRAIRWGSRNEQIHDVAIEIDLHCDKVGIDVTPVWTERSHYIIQEADKRGRLVEPNDFCTPPLVIQEAHRVSRWLWGRPLSFDRAASALNALPGMLFNSLWPQVGSAGIDLFRQTDWGDHTNFVHLPFGQLPRLFAFLPSTRAKAVVLAPMIYARQWTPMTLPGAPGLIHRVIYSPGISPLLTHRSKHPSEMFRGQYALLFYDFSGPRTAETPADLQPPTQ